MERRKTYSAVLWDSRDFWQAVTYDMVHKPAHVGRKVMQPFMGSRPGFNVFQEFVRKFYLSEVND